MGALSFQLLNTRQLAEELNTTADAIRQRNRRGSLPIPIRVGARLFWRREDVETWMAESQRAEREFRATKRNGGRR